MELLDDVSFIVGLSGMSVHYRDPQQQRRLLCLSIIKGEFVRSKLAMYRGCASSPISSKSLRFFAQPWNHKASGHLRGECYGKPERVHTCTSQPIYWRSQNPPCLQRPLLRRARNRVCFVRCRERATLEGAKFGYPQARLPWRILKGVAGRLKVR